MANRTVLTWPCASLKKTSLVIPDDFFNKGLDTLVADMCDTLAVKMGSGLAAPQIGVNKRVIIVKATDFTEKNPDPYEKDSNIIVMVNPEVELSGEDVRWSEGCLSVPGFTAEVTRKSQARVDYKDTKGNKKSIDAEWPFSGAIQHEYDHLAGRLFIDRIGRFSGDAIRKKIQKRIKERKKATELIRRESLVDLHGEAAVRKMERPKRKRNKKFEKIKKKTRQRNRKK